MKSITETQLQNTYETRKMFRYGLICALLWTLLILGLVFTEMLLEIKQHSYQLSSSGITASTDAGHEAMNNKMQEEALIFSCIWLVGLGFIWFLTQKIVRTMRLLSNERNKLHESEEQLRVIFDTSESGIIVVSPRGVVDFANRRMAEIFGMTLEELIGTSYPDHLHESEKQVGDQQMRWLINGDIQFVSLDRRYIRRDGTDFWGHLSGRRLENQDGSLRSLVGVITDITKRKLSEDELKRTKKRYEALFTRAGDGIFILSADGKLIEVNESFARMHGYTAEEMTQMKLRDLDTPETFLTAADRLARLLGGEALTFEVEHYHKDGHVLQLEVSASLISSDGEAYIQCFHRDISERKRAEEERRKLEQQFHHAQKLESLGVLAGGIAHDFNNILTIILGQCYRGRTDLTTEQEFKTAFQHIETAANRAADLCRQMLTYAGRTEFEQSNLKLCQLVEDAVKMLQSGIRKNVALELDLKQAIPKIKGDIGQIQQIVMNLVINAVEAIGDETGTVRVSLSKTVYETDQDEKDAFGADIEAGSYACLEVADTGAGMDEDTQKRIFEPFFTTKFTGRGLGLSAINGIVKSHKALLLLSSAPGKGTTFRVLFRVAEADDAVNDSPAVSTPSRQTRGNLLLVEDEQTLRNMGEILLETLGFTVITAANGREGVDMYLERRSEIDVILLDLIMPVMGGIEAYHELRKLSPAIPVIICSGYGIESLKGIINNDENARFVHKPYKPLELRDVIMELIK